MDRLAPLPRSFAETRDSLHRVAVHVVARSRQQATGRFGLRVTPGGFGTPEHGPSLDRVRVDGVLLVRESGGVDAARSAARSIDGATLAELAAFAGVDLAADLDVGHDTPLLADVDQPLSVDVDAADALAAWYALTARALDAVVSTAAPGASPTLAQLWPEHFDVALDVAAAADRRTNLGGSPGDGFHEDPYLYVGPWTAHRPGDQRFWNAPFGALLGFAEVAAAADPVVAAAGFFRRGLEMLAG